LEVETREQLKSWLKINKLDNFK